MNQILLNPLKWHNHLKNSLLLFLLVFELNSAKTQDLYDLSRCIKTGLEQNFSLQVERNQESIDANNFTPGNAGMLPKITNTNRLGGSLNNVEQNYSDGTDASTSGIHNTSGSASIDLGMTIFKGFQVKNTYKKLEQQSELGGLKTQMAVENLVAQIVSEYHYYVQQLILYNNMAYAVSLSRERVRIDEQRYLLGSASKMQLLQSMVYLNADSSRYARQKEVLHTSQIKLNELMASEDLGRVLIIKDTVIPINEDLLYEQLLSQTLENNTELQIATKNQQISAYDYKIIASRAYPYLNLNTSYGYNFNNYGTGDYSSQQTAGLNYGVTFGIDIFDGFNRKRERSNARIELENKQIQFNEIEQAVKADLLTLYYAYENNLRLLRLEEQNLEVARENLEIALEQYKLGSLAGLELREVQKSLLDAEERLISVKFMTKLAEISLHQISGRIMDYL